jgi:hypothetical protein
MMNIVILGANTAPSWEALQGVISTSLGREGVLTRIQRPDNQCNYRAPGQYICRFTPYEGDEVTVSLQINS